MTRFDPNCTSAFSLIKSIDAYQDGPLSGLSFAVKDLIDTQGDISSCGNPSWHATHQAAQSNAICVDQLLSAGAHCVGKTKTNEFAFGLTGENDFYGTALNPNAPERIPGGSSAGSASAVASGACDFALGTDTGGSVRVPASNCGVWGIRPSSGRISVAGVNPLASSFDSVGVFAKDGNTLLRSTLCLLGHDPDQFTPQKKYPSTIWLPSDILTQCDDAVATACLDWAEKLKTDYNVKVCDLGERCNIDSNLAQLFKHYCQIHWREIWNNLGDWVSQTQPELGEATAINFELARNADRSQLFQAFCFKQKVAQAITQLLRNDALLLLPSTPSIPPIKGQVSLDRTKGDYLPRLSGISSLAAFAACPQVSIPVAQIDGIPQGLSLMAAPGKDEWLLSLCEHMV